MVSGMRHSTCMVVRPERSEQAEPWSTWWLITYPKGHPHAGNHVLAVGSIREGDRKYLSTATHVLHIASEADAGASMRRWQFPAGTDACALARAQNFIDMFKSGLMDPASPPEDWIRVLLLPAGEMGLPRVPGL